jgi:hypothetical protein
MMKKEHDGHNRTHETWFKWAAKDPVTGEAMPRQGYQKLAAPAKNKICNVYNRHSLWE